MGDESRVWDERTPCPDSASVGRSSAGRRLVHVLTALGTLSCGGSEASEPRGLSALPSLQARVTARVDGTAHDLLPVTGSALGQNGLIAVEQRQADQIRLFDASGALRGTLGRDGDAPGEFRGVVKLGWTGDSLWAWDPWQRRVTLFPRVSSDSGAKVYRVPSVIQPAPALADSLSDLKGIIVIHARYPDGSLQLAKSVRVSDLSGDPELFQLHVRVRPDGTYDRILAIYPLPKLDISVRSEEGVRTLGLPWVSQPLTAMSGDGARLAIAKASLEGPDAGSFHVVMIGGEGDTLYSRHYAFEGVPIPPAVADSVVEERLALVRGRSADLARAYRRAVKVPPVFPPLQSLVMGLDGKLWVRILGEGWIVLDEAGAPEARVSLPGGSVIAADGDIVWAVEHDEYDVPSLIRYELQRRN